ncbi:CinA family protein [Desulfoscipio gibsoniae]|uniref:Competence/damage-inducible protein CinA-like protein n=1 Tax=Desulfoscipio gibsoniae DSM 7213 TaxID=767817 RepID=R4KDS4_9FIRM|nr:nicotinamide-nucleotide amidohydrolase family protein [Desulfoscipio gibsoniae]AGL01328.1 competence/damage-inducible protein CinA-like protein [Desulfoscipio gibsoniae DSM 7213]
MDGEIILTGNYAEESLKETVGVMLVERGLTVSLAESCTGGQVMKYLSDVPGSSRYLAGGVVAYSNELKVNLLGVSRVIIDRHGAVSEPTARLMAEGVQNVTGTSLGVGITGIAGPGGGTEEKPVGLVYIAVAGENKTVCQRYVFSGQRIEVRSSATSAALQMLCQYLMDMG